MTHPLARAVERGPVTGVAEFMPPPFLEDLRAVGILTDEEDEEQARLAGKAGRNARDKHTEYVRARVSATLARLADHLVESRLIDGVKTRSDLLNAALFFYIERLVSLAKNGTLATEMLRLKEEKRIYASRLRIHHGDEFADTVRKSARLALIAGDAIGARESLRSALAFSERLPEGTQERFSNRMFGDPDGRARPDEWAEDPVAVMWAEVLDEAPEGEEREVL